MAPVGGRFPAPEMVSFRTGYGMVSSPAYYYGAYNPKRVGDIIPEPNAKKRIDEDELPPAAPGNKWRFAVTTEGKVYWVEEGAAAVDAAEARRAEQQRKDAEKAAYIDRAMKRDMNAPPPAAPSAPPESGTVSGLKAMRERLNANQQTIGSVFGASVKVTETATGFDYELFSDKAGVSTGVDGEKIGIITLDKVTGKPIAIDVAGVTSTEDGRLIFGKGFERYGLSVKAKVAINVNKAVVAAAGGFTYFWTNVGAGLGLGGMSADNKPGL